MNSQSVRHAYLASPLQVQPWNRREYRESEEESARSVAAPGRTSWHSVIALLRLHGAPGRLARAAIRWSVVGRYSLSPAARPADPLVGHQQRWSTRWTSSFPTGSALPAASSRRPAARRRDSRCRSSVMVKLAECAAASARARFRGERKRHGEFRCHLADAIKSVATTSFPFSSFSSSAPSTWIRGRCLSPRNHGTGWRSGSRASVVLGREGVQPTETNAWSRLTRAGHRRVCLVLVVLPSTSDARDASHVRFWTSRSCSIHDTFDLENGRKVNQRPRRSSHSRTRET